MRRRRAGWWAAVSASTLLWAAVASSGAVQAAGIAWETNGPFQACLEAEATAWIAARAELIVNEDPAAGKIDDPAVATWTMQALKACEAKAGRSDQASEQLFVRYMAHWRGHIDAAAATLKRRSPPD